MPVGARASKKKGPRFSTNGVSGGCVASMPCSAKIWTSFADSAVPAIVERLARELLEGWWLVSGKRATAWVYFIDCAHLVC